MKKNLLLLFFLIIAYTANSQHLKKIVAEKYYVADATDAADASANPNGDLKAGSVTWRLYVEMDPDWYIVNVYGNSYHPLVFSTTATKFFNAHGTTNVSPSYTNTTVKTGLNALDSYLAMGSPVKSTSNALGLIKSEDDNGSVLSTASLLNNVNTYSGEAIKTKDGMVSVSSGGSVNPSFTSGFSTFLEPIFGDGDYTNINNITVTNGNWSNTVYMKGPKNGIDPNSNRVLIAQLTSEQIVNYSINITIGHIDDPINDLRSLERYLNSPIVDGDLIGIPSNYTFFYDPKYKLNGSLNPTSNLPTVSITSPANGSIFSEGNEILLEANASDEDGSIKRVEFLLNGSKIGESTQAPYKYLWNGTAQVATLTAKAYDYEGNSKTSSAVNITIESNQLPTVSVSSPINTDKIFINDPVTLRATANDPDGSIFKVEFFVDNVSAGIDNSSPFECPNPWIAILGQHLIKAVATDNKGASAISPEVTIDVVNNKPPSISILTPVANGQIKKGEPYKITTNAADEDGNITKVIFFVDGAKIGEVTSAPFELNYAWNGDAQVGDHTLTAQAYDNKNSYTFSDDVPFKVIIGNTAPSVSITSPVDNSNFKAGDEVTINADASDSEGTVASVEFFLDDVSLGIDNIAPFSIKFQAGSIGLHVLKAKATDNEGALNISNNVTIEILNNKPNISITSPATNTIINKGETITVNAEATDVAGTITRVEFYANNTLINTDTEAPYSFSFTANSEANNVLKAIAYDNDGGSNTSSEVILLVNTPPFVNITSPGNNEVFVFGGTISITANATDPDVNSSVKKVEFFVDNISIGSDDIAPYLVTYTLIKGAHTITAKATDNNNSTTTSGAIQILVNDPPSVSISFPSNSASFKNGENVIITASASDSDGSISKVEFFMDNVSIGSDNSAPYSINYSAVVGSHSIKAIATDDKNANTTSSLISISIVENAAPVISITSPTNGSITLARDGDPLVISATGSDPDGTISKVVFYVDGNSIDTVKISPFTTNKYLAHKGSHQITAKAFDNNNAETISTPFTVVITVTGIEEVLGEETLLELFPNPAKDILFMELTMLNNYDAFYKIFDLNGRLIIEKSITLNKGMNMVEINVSSLKNGQYLLKLLIDGNFKTFKFLKQE